MPTIEVGNIIAAGTVNDTDKAYRILTDPINMAYFNWNPDESMEGTGNVTQVMVVKTSLNNITVGDYVTNGILNNTAYVFVIDNDPTATSGQTYFPQNLANGFGGDYTTSGFIISKQLA